MKDSLKGYERFLPLKEIKALRDSQLNEFNKNSHWDNYRTLLEDFTFPEDVSLKDDSLFHIRANPELEEQLSEKLKGLIQALLPWRKGPFNLLGEEIDAEWRADKKWDRIKDALPNVAGKRVVDVGCNNGYHMFRMLQRNPQLVLGLDPSSRCYYQFEFLNSFAKDRRLHFEPFGIQDLHLFPEFFHLALCMGVIYHRRDPYTSCRMLYDSLKPEGTLIMESLVIPGDDTTALIPEDRYAKMRNVWYVPTVNCLKVWLMKAGFQEIEELTTDVVTFKEQRKTRLAPYESLEDFLNPDDHSKTMEGYPAPTRAIVIARKG